MLLGDYLENMSGSNKKRAFDCTNVLTEIKLVIFGCPLSSVQLLEPLYRCRQPINNILTSRMKSGERADQRPSAEMSLGVSD